MKPFKISGFTLIELLIVVAIIAILAAIAVPNFLEAQTRAKVSRAKADMRSLHTAIESYHLDHSKYLYSNRPAFAIKIASRPNHRPTLERLSTPIAYLNSATAFIDPFLTRGIWNAGWTAKNELAANDKEASRIYFYYARNERAGGNARWDQAENDSSLPVRWWMLESAGPDGYRYNGDKLNGNPAKAELSVAMYDASNGTVSDGSIWRGGGTPPTQSERNFYDLIQGQY